MSCLSRCHRSSFKVSIEKPMRTGPACGDGVAAVVDVSCGAFTHDAAVRSTKRSLRIRISPPDVGPALSRSAPAGEPAPRFITSPELELPFQSSFGVRTDPHFELSRLRDPTAIGPELQIVTLDRERHPLRFVRPQRYALKSLQLLHRSGDAGHWIADVHLHDLFSSAIAGIAHVCRDFEAVDANVAVIEFRVRLTEAEWIQRPDRHIEIFARVFVFGIGGRPVGRWL